MSVSCYGVDGSYNEGEDSPRHSPMLTAVRPNFNPRESPPPLQLPQGPTAKARGTQAYTVLIHSLASGQNPEIAQMAGEPTLPGESDTAEDDSGDSDDSDGPGSGNDGHEQVGHARLDGNDYRDRGCSPADEGPKLRELGPIPTTRTDQLNLQTLAAGALTALTSDQANNDMLRPEHIPGTSLVSYDFGLPGHDKPLADEDDRPAYGCFESVPRRAAVFSSHRHSKLATSITGSNTACLASSNGERSLSPQGRINDLHAHQFSPSHAVGEASLDRAPISTSSINDATTDRLDDNVGVAVTRRVKNGSVSQSPWGVSILSITEPTSTKFVTGTGRAGRVEGLGSTSSHMAHSISPVSTSPPASSFNTSFASPRIGELPPLQQRPDQGRQILLPPLRSLGGFTTLDSESLLQHPFPNLPRPSITLTRSRDGLKPNHASPPLSPDNFSPPIHSTPKLSPGMFPLAPVPVLPPHDRSIDAYIHTIDAVSVGVCTGATRGNMRSAPTSSPSSMLATTDIMAIDTMATPSFICRHPDCKVPPFATQYLLNSHANVHSSSRPHYCPVPGCARSAGGVGFKRKNEMIRHGLVHESPGYVCPFCPQRDHRYPRPDNLQRHVRVHHPEKDKDHQLLRDVLAQRPEGQNRGRRRRGATAIK